MRAMVELVLDTGLRISEFTSLKKDQIDYEKKEIKVRNCKTKEWGKVFLTDRSIEWIKLYLSQRTDSFPELFMADNQKAIYKRTPHMQLRKIKKNLPFGAKLTFTTLRRTLATFLIYNKVNIKNVQYIMRHKSDRTTLQHYIGLDNKEAIKEHEKVMEKI
jgi:integrase